jgi:hypothetical protein
LYELKKAKKMAVDFQAVDVPSTPDHQNSVQFEDVLASQNIPLRIVHNNLSDAQDVEVSLPLTIVIPGNGMLLKPTAPFNGPVVDNKTVYALGYEASGSIMASKSAVRKKGFLKQNNSSTLEGNDNTSITLYTKGLNSNTSSLDTRPDGTTLKLEDQDTLSKWFPGGLKSVLAPPLKKNVSLETQPAVPDIQITNEHGWTVDS